MDREREKKPAKCVYVSNKKERLTTWIRKLE